MKKFLAVFDGYKMSHSTMEYAIRLSQAGDALLVGIFLDEFIYRNYNVYKVVTRAENPDAVIKELDAKDKNTRDKSVLKFEAACRTAGIEFIIHRDQNIAIQELKHESMFADLIIIDENETFTKYKEQPPTDFVKELLGDVQCPVLVVPSKFKAIDKLVLLYDGRPSSLHAIKMFSYLFFNLKKLHVEVYTVQDQHMKGLRVPDNKLMKEFIKRHFPKAKYTIVKGRAEEKIVAHLDKRQQNELVVLGAYQRGEMSRLFKTSMADILMRELDTPLFIAHNK